MKPNLFGKIATSIYVLIMLFWSIESSAISQLDQSSESGIQLGTLGQPDNAQTFTVGMKGILTEIQVQVQRNTAITNDLFLDVRGTSTGIPLEDDASVLATTSYSANSLSIGTPTWLSFDVRSQNIDVDNGDLLAIVLRAPTAVDSANYFWMGATNDPYTGGQRWGRSGTWAGGVLGDTWNGNFAQFATSDMNFRAFINPIPLPPALYVFGSGLLWLIQISRRKS